MPTVLAIAAHPDDIEFVMVGTLLQLQQRGYDVHYLNIANGDCGSTIYGREELASLREAEGRAACQLGRFTFHRSLCSDLQIFYDQSLLMQVASLVRDVQPEIVLTHSPTDYMEDHTNACRLAVTATFGRCLANLPVQPPRSATFQPVALYHAQPHGNRDPLGQRIRPTHFVNVEPHWPNKATLLECHRSQKDWLDQTQGMGAYVETMRGLMQEVGAMSGRFTLAEGWRQHLHLGFSPAGFDPLRAALEPHDLLFSPLT